MVMKKRRFSLPGEYRYSLDSGVEFAKQLEEKGLKSIIVFGIPAEDTKDEIATPDYSSTGIVQKLLEGLKRKQILSSLLMCAYANTLHMVIVE